MRFASVDDRTVDAGELRIAGQRALRDEIQVARNRQLQRPDDGCQLGYPHGAQLGHADADIAQAEKAVSPSSGSSSVSSQVACASGVNSLTTGLRIVVAAVGGNPAIDNRCIPGRFRTPIHDQSNT